MKIAISVAHEIDLNAAIRFERARGALFDDITLLAPSCPPIDNYISVGTNNPFYSDGRYLHDGFYTADILPEQLTFQSTMFGWWRNDVYMRQLRSSFDVVVAVDGLDRFDFKSIVIPPPNTILCNDELNSFPLSSNFSCWAARPSDYSRLSAGWKFFRFVHRSHLHLDMHRENIELDQDHSDYMWKFWLDVQNINIQQYEN